MYEGLKDFSKSQLQKGKELYIFYHINTNLEFKVRQPE
jgi:hypothetical protein